MLPLLPAIATAVGAGARGDLSLLRAQILDLPAQLLEATAPVTLSGVVADAGTPGQLRVTTPVGDIQLRIPNDIPVGRAVTIVIRPGARLEAFVLPAGPTAQPASTPAPPMAQMPAPTNVLTPPAASKPETAPAPTGFVLPAATGTIAVSPAITAPTPTIATPPDLAKGAAASPQPAPTAVRLPAPPTLSPASILATLGMAEVPESIGATPYALPTMLPPTSELVALVTDMRRLVAGRDPALSDRLLRRLPGTDRAGSVALAALPLAADRGVLSAWFGRSIKEALDEAGDGDLMGRLEAALTAPEQRSDDTGESPWRWRQVPFVDHGQVVPLFIGVAPDREEPQSANTAARQRPRVYEFAVEVTLSSLGRTRIDATYQQRQLDLAVRCETEIGKTTREQIVAAIGNVFAEFGLGGSCRFEPLAGRAAGTGAVKV